MAGTTSDKLQGVLSSKLAIKTAIEEKGQTVGNATFAQYADKIRAISTGVEPRLGVAVDDGQGNIKFQPLSFTGTTPSDDGALDDFTGYIYNTGKDEPVFPGGGGGEVATCDFYKCTAVDTTTKTWSGNKAILQDGVYTFSPDITSGLKYTELIPSVGKIYSSDTLVEVSSLYQGGLVPNGLVFYASMRNEYAETEQVLTLPPSAQFTTIQDIPCCYLSDFITFPDTGFPMGRSANSISAWIYPISLPSSWGNAWVDWGEDRWYSHRTMGIQVDQGNIFMTGVAYSDCIGGEIQVNKWAHYASVMNSTHTFNYINGVETGREIINSQVNVALTGTARAGFGTASGYLASVRIYDRALTQEEVIQLSQEFHPEA